VQGVSGIRWGSDAPAIHNRMRPLTVQSGSDTYVASHMNGHHALIKYTGVDMSESNPERQFTIGYQDGNMTQDTTLNYYEGNAKHYYDGTVNINMTVLYTPFLTYMPTYASILDAGCGSGRDALYFASRGYQVTAFDYSPTLVNLATKLTGQEVLNLSFQDLAFEDQFNGIWACSSLMHVPLDEMHDALFKLSRAIKVDGVMYASFIYGTGEHNRHGRLFVDLDEDGCGELIKLHPELAVIRCWKTSDLRPGRENEKWLNLLIRKARRSKRMTFLGVGQSPSPQ